MQKNNPFFDDIAKMATGAASSLLEMRHEVEKMVQSQIEKVSAKMNLVSREEFEVVRDMAQKARTETLALRKELDAQSPSKKAAPKAKPAAKPATAKKPSVAKKTTAKKSAPAKNGATKKDA